MLITLEKGPASQGGWPWPRWQLLAQLSFFFIFIFFLTLAVFQSPDINWE